MATHTNPPKDPGTPAPNAWMYDYVMRRIEPDLTTEMLPLLEEKYRGEDRDETAYRLQRYEEAFALFDVMFEQICRLSEQDARAQKESARSLLHLREQVMKQGDAQTLKHLLGTDE